MTSIKIKQNRLYYLDQTKLPLKEVWRECKSLSDGWHAIKELQVRGAPLIGVFAAYCISIEMRWFSLSDKERFLNQTRQAIKHLKTSRPTAVNLFWALNRLEKTLEKYQNESAVCIKKRIEQEAKSIHREDVLLCQRMAEYGARLIKKNETLLTHCNTGFLATSGDGTALAIIYRAHKQGKRIKVYVDETRPLLQGARLTSWELMRRGVKCRLISDNMAAYLMQKKQIDRVFVGADRIAANGDTANKIGTYSVAVAAQYHKIPFYVVAPFSTFDLKLKTGAGIPIEERHADEVRCAFNQGYIAPKKVEVYNPAFDVTPHKLIAAIVTDQGIIYPPFEKNIKKIIAGSISWRDKSSTKL